MNTSASSRHTVNFLVLVCLLLVATGCSRFRRDWNAAASSSPPTDDIQGRWGGSWLSDHNGHQGRLRCLLTRDHDGNYQARFHAKYRRILSFSYTVPLKVEREGDSFEFSGEADLGALAGGVYNYEGVATPENFFSIYTNKYDFGTFRMTRPE